MLSPYSSGLPGGSGGLAQELTERRPGARQQQTDAEQARGKADGEPGRERHHGERARDLPAGDPGRIDRAAEDHGPPVEGFVKSEAKRRDVSESEVIGEITSNMPLGEIPKDDDVANACIFFCSDYSRMVTGETLLVNAGEILR